MIRQQLDVTRSDVTKSVTAILAGAFAMAVALTMTAPGATASTLEVTGPAGASLSVDGRDLGFLPLPGPLELAPGHHEVHCEMPGYQAYHQKLRLVRSNDRHRLVVRLTPLSRRTAWSSNLLLAGLGQFYTGNKIRGWTYAAAEVGGLLTALAGETTRSNAEKDYLVLQDQYDNALSSFELEQLRVAVGDKHQDMKDAEDLRDLGLMVAGGAIAVSIIDALLTFPNFETGPGPVPPRQRELHDDTALGNTSFDHLAFHAAVRLEF